MKNGRVLFGVAGAAFFILVGMGIMAIVDRDKVDRATVAAAAPTTSALAVTTLAPFISLSPTSAATVPEPTEPPTTAPQEAAEVLNFSGVANGSSEDFTVGKSWQLTWTVVGGAGIHVEILTPAGKTVDTISIDPGQNTSHQRVACTCYLKVTTFGAKSFNLIVTNLP